MKIYLALIVCSFLSFALPTLAQQCGSAVGGKVCPNGLCCSQWGFCGDTDAYCGAGCQSQCVLQLIPSTDVRQVINEQTLDMMNLTSGDANEVCLGKQTWPKLVGMWGQSAAIVIRVENHYILQTPIILTGTVVPKDEFRCDRVRVWVNRQGNVIRLPVVG